MSVRRSYADTTNGQVHYRTAGNESGIPVVLFHQTASSSVMFEAVMDRLHPRRCIALDTPGFGNSSPVTPATISAWADVLAGVLQTMGIRDMDVVGHHTGAAIACAVAIRHPGRIRHLALGGPPLLSDGTKHRIRTSLHKLKWQSDGSHLLTAWRRSWGYAPRGPIELVQRETLLLLEAHAPHLAMEAVLDFDLATALASIDSPLLVLAGDSDPIIEGVRDAAARRTGTMVAVIPEAGVHVFDEQPDAVARTLAAFFDDQYTEGG